MEKKERQEQDRILTEGFEKVRSTLMGGKMYKELRPQRYQDPYLVISFLFLIFRNSICSS